MTLAAEPDHDISLTDAIGTRRWPWGLCVGVALALALNLAPAMMPYLDHTWDAHVHAFMAEHYTRGWFSPWEPRWFLGFWVYSYPPLTHQLVSLLGNLVKVDVAYRIVQLLAMVAVVPSTYLLTERQWGQRAASVSAVLAAVCSGLFVISYVFGQLPSLVAVPMALLSLWYLEGYLARGRLTDLLGWTAWGAAAAATHHHTVFVVLPLLAAATVIQRLWRSRVHRPVVLRSSLAAGCLVLASLLVIVPFWWWYLTQSLPQVEIPHPTRALDLTVPRYRDLFVILLLGVQGPLALVGLGYAAVKRQSLAWVAAVVLLGILGAGLLTPVPSWIFGSLSRWLTYERFTLWAALAALPLAGAALAALPGRWRAITTGAVTLAAASLCAVAASYSFTHRILPPLLPSHQEQVIVEWLNRECGDHAYLTLGLGEAQFGRISRQVDAVSIDGLYYTARWRTEQRQSGLGSLDASIYTERNATIWDEDRDILDLVLQLPEHWHLRYVLSAEAGAEDLLRGAGWRLRERIPDDPRGAPPVDAYSPISIWEAPDGETIPPSIARQKIGPPYYEESAGWKGAIKGLFPYLWGLLPLTALVIALGVSLRTLTSATPTEG